MSDTDTQEEDSALLEEKVAVCNGAIVLPRALLPSRGPLAMVLKPHFERGLTSHFRNHKSSEPQRQHDTLSKRLPPADKSETRHRRKKKEPRVFTILQMNPLPHTRHKVVEHTDRDLEMMKSLSRRRRNPVPDIQKVAVQEDPTANILSQWYEPNARTKFLKEKGLVLLPPPSLMRNKSESDAEESLEDEDDETDTSRRDSIPSQNIRGHSDTETSTPYEDESVSLISYGLKSVEHLHFVKPTPVPTTATLPTIHHQRREHNIIPNADLSWQKNVPGYRDTIEEIDFYLTQKPVVIYMKKKNGQAVPKPMKRNADNISLPPLQ